MELLLRFLNQQVKVPSDHSLLRGVQGVRVSKNLIALLAMLIAASAVRLLEKCIFSGFIRDLTVSRTASLVAFFGT